MVELTATELASVEGGRSLQVVVRAVTFVVVFERVRQWFGL